MRGKSLTCRTHRLSITGSSGRSNIGRRPKDPTGLAAGKSATCRASETDKPQRRIIEPIRSGHLTLIGASFSLLETLWEAKQRSAPDWTLSNIMLETQSKL